MGAIGTLAILPASGEPSLSSAFVGIAEVNDLWFRFFDFLRATTNNKIKSARTPAATAYIRARFSEEIFIKGNFLLQCVYELMMDVTVARDRAASVGAIDAINVREGSASLAHHNV